jgi:hypothetical protein
LVDLPASAMAMWAVTATNARPQALSEATMNNVRAEILVISVNSIQ